MLFRHSISVSGNCSFFRLSTSSDQRETDLRFYCRREMTGKRQQLDAGSHSVRLQPPPPDGDSMELVLHNSDLLREILLGVPVKFLIRCKSVCKKWLSLISSDNFCKEHTLRRPKLQQSLILQMHNLQFFYFNQTINAEKKVAMIPYDLSVPDHQILQECNGLLLLEYERPKNSYYTYNPATKGLERRPRNSYYVYNPATRRSRKINLKSNDKYPCVAAVNLAFDPSESPYYKIVCIRSTEDSYSEDHQIEVYDSQSHTWKISLESFTSSKVHEGVYWNDSIYWRIGSGYCCYDIGRNVIRRLSLPQLPTLETYKPCEYLQESNGHLYHFEIFEKDGGVAIAVWKLSGIEHTEWLLQYHRVVNGMDKYSGAVRLMGISDRDGDGMCSLFTCDAAKMKTYNFPEESYEDLVGITNQLCHWPISTARVMRGFLFGEILALV